MLSLLWEYLDLFHQHLMSQRITADYPFRAIIFPQHFPQ